LNQIRPFDSNNQLDEARAPNQISRMSETPYHPTDFFPVSNLLQRQNPFKILRASIASALNYPCSATSRWTQLGAAGHERPLSAGDFFLTRRR
jgi:hypothetical protein